MLEEMDFEEGKYRYQITYNNNIVYNRRENMKIEEKIPFQKQSFQHIINSAICILFYFILFIFINKYYYYYYSHYLYY